MLWKKWEENAAGFLNLIKNKLLSINCNKNDGMECQSNKKESDFKN